MNHFHLVELLHSRSNLQTGDRSRGLWGTDSPDCLWPPPRCPPLLLSGVVGQILGLRPCLGGLGEPPQLLVPRQLPAPVGSLVTGPTTSPTSDTTNNLMPVTKPTQNLQCLNRMKMGYHKHLPYGDESGNTLFLHERAAPSDTQKFIQCIESGALRTTQRLIRGSQ